MRLGRKWGAVLLPTVIAFCGPAVQVRTVANPAANLSRLHTYRIMSNPRWRGQRPLRIDDPMLENSIVNRNLREDLRRGFEQKGYVVDDVNPDFMVAYYASAREKLDITYYDYGYAWWPRWWDGGRDAPAAQAIPYTEGTVIIDVVDPRSHELLWRGSGVATVSDDVQQYMKDMDQTVAAILEKFPRARMHA